jgi:hypothetical protein
VPASAPVWSSVRAYSRGSRPQNNVPSVTSPRPRPLGHGILITSSGHHGRSVGASAAPAAAPAPAAGALPATAGGRRHARSSGEPAGPPGPAVFTVPAAAAAAPAGLSADPGRGAPEAAISLSRAVGPGRSCAGPDGGGGSTSTSCKMGRGYQIVEKFTSAAIKSSEMGCCAAGRAAPSLEYSNISHAHTHRNISHARTHSDIS